MQPNNRSVWRSTKQCVKTYPLIWLEDTNNLSPKRNGSSSFFTWYLIPASNSLAYTEIHILPQRNGASVSIFDTILNDTSSDSLCMLEPRRHLNAQAWKNQTTGIGPPWNTEGLLPAVVLVLLGLVPQTAILYRDWIGWTAIPTAGPDRTRTATDE